MARRACGSRPVVSSSRKTTSGSLISASAMNSRCFCPPESVMNHASRLSARPSCSSSWSPSRRLPAVERRPELHRLPHLDPLLQLRLLQLHADPLLQLVDVAEGIEAEHADRTAVGRPDALDAFHGRGLAGSVRADQAEDLTVGDVERDVIDGHGLAIGLADGGDLDDGTRGALSTHPVTSPPSASVSCR